MRFSTPLGCAVLLLALLFPGVVSAQYGQQQPPAGNYDQGGAAQQPPAAGYGQQPAPAGQAQQPPPSGYGQQQPPPGGYGQQQPPPGGYGQQQPSSGYNNQGGYGYGAPPPPPRRERSGFQMPDISIRLDPFNWLLEGRLGLELEAGLWEFISLEAVPVFVVNKEPPSFNFSGREDNLSQESRGWGMLSGASLGVGFWLTGKPFKSYFLKAIITNYSYGYRTVDVDGVLIDRARHVDRRLVAMFGSQSNFGAFSIVGGIGLGYELNQRSRCFPTGRIEEATQSGCPDEGEFHVALDRPTTGDPITIVDLNGPLHPIYLVGRISLGATF